MNLEADLCLQYSSTESYPKFMILLNSEISGKFTVVFINAYDAALFFNQGARWDENSILAYIWFNKLFKL